MIDFVISHFFVVTSVIAWFITLIVWFANMKEKTFDNSKQKQKVLLHTENTEISKVFFDTFLTKRDFYQSLKSLENDIAFIKEYIINNK